MLVGNRHICVVVEEIFVLHAFNTSIGFRVWDKRILCKSNLQEVEGLAGYKGDIDNPSYNPSISIHDNWYLITNYSDDTIKLWNMCLFSNASSLTYICNSIFYLNGYYFSQNKINVYVLSKNYEFITSYAKPNHLIQNKVFWFSIFGIKLRTFSEWKRFSCTQIYRRQW